MSWDISIKGFKSYLQIERSLSDNSIDNYIRDVRKLASFCLKEKIKPINIVEGEEVEISIKELPEILKDVN